jgi:hypothetical protein
MNGERGKSRDAFGHRPILKLGSTRPVYMTGQNRQGEGGGTVKMQAAALWGAAAGEAFASDRVSSATVI